MSRAERNPGEGGEEESDEDDRDGVVLEDDERLLPLLFRNVRAVCQSGRLRAFFWCCAHTFLYLII